MAKIRGLNGTRFVPVEQWRDDKARVRLIKNLSFEHEPVY
jgi:hypothetical protein